MYIWCIHHVYYRFLESLACILFEFDVPARFTCIFTFRTHLCYIPAVYQCIQMIYHCVLGPLGLQKWISSSIWCIQPAHLWVFLIYTCNINFHTRIMVFWTIYRYIQQHINTYFSFLELASSISSLCFKVFALHNSNLADSKATRDLSLHGSNIRMQLKNSVMNSEEVHTTNW